MSKDSGSGGGRVGCVCECGCNWNGRVDGGGCVCVYDDGKGGIQEKSSDAVVLRL